MKSDSQPDINSLRETDPINGLTRAQVEERKTKGLTNDQGGAATKSIGQIIATNLCTLLI